MWKKVFRSHQPDRVITSSTVMVTSEAGFISDIFILSAPSYFSAGNSKTTVLERGLLSLISYLSPSRKGFAPETQANQMVAC